MVNGGITEDVVHNTYKEIAVGEEYNRLARPSRRNQSGVYQYSTAIDQATRLHKEDFINFGNILTINVIITLTLNRHT